MRGGLLVHVALILAIIGGEARAERVLLAVTVTTGDVEQAAVYDFVRASFEAHGDTVARVDGAGASLDANSAITLARSAGATAAVLVFVTNDGQVRMQVFEVATGESRSDVEARITPHRGLDAIIEDLVPRARVRVAQPVPVRLAPVSRPVVGPPAGLPIASRQEPDTEPEPTPASLEPVSETPTSAYAWQLLLFDAAAIGLMVANLDPDDRSCWGFCTMGGILALGGYAVLVPSVHVMHRRADAAGTSIGLRLGIPVFAMAVFGLPIKYGTRDELHPGRGETAIQITLAAGMGVALLADTTFAFADPLLENRKKRRAKQQAFAPMFRSTRDGFVASVGGTF